MSKYLEDCAKINVDDLGAAALASQAAMDGGGRTVGYAMIDDTGYRVRYDPSVPVADRYSVEKIPDDEPIDLTLTPMAYAVAMIDSDD